VTPSCLPPRPPFVFGLRNGKALLDSPAGDRQATRPGRHSPRKRSRQLGRRVARAASANKTVPISLVERDHGAGRCHAAELQQRPRPLCAARIPCPPCCVLFGRVVDRRLGAVAHPLAPQIDPLRAPHPSGIEELREKREDLNRSVAQDEEEKGTLAMGPGGEAQLRCPEGWSYERAARREGGRAAYGAQRPGTFASSSPLLDHPQPRFKTTCAF
jgi:hypothetical protein